MTLKFEDNGEEYSMEVTELKKELPENINGVRFLNTIRLKSKVFYDFIMALTVDDFEAIKEILKTVKDLQTQELPYRNGIEHLYLSNDYKTQKELNNTVIF